MNKELTLDHLHAAKKAHVSWVSRAKALIVGLPVQREQIPVDCTACKFGEWFYSDTQALKSIPGMDCLSKIEDEHYNLHDYQHVHLYSRILIHEHYNLIREHFNLLVIYYHQHLSESLGLQVLVRVLLYLHLALHILLYLHVHLYVQNFLHNLDDAPFFSYFFFFF